MEFCTDCGTRLRPVLSSETMFCRKCRNEVRLPSQPIKSLPNNLTTRVPDSVITIESSNMDLDVLPTTRMECPECAHNRAYYRTLEIWDDDGDTSDYQLYRCTKCKHTWREKA